MATKTYRRKGGRRRRLSQEQRSQIEREALGRARDGASWSNFPAVINGFAAKGIPEADIEPRVNVFTYHAWRALGRQVRKGEHGVGICTYVAMDGECTRCRGGGCDKCSGTGQRSGRIPRTATVFHVTQTDTRDANGHGGRP